MHKVTNHNIVDFDLQPFIGRSVKVRFMVQVVLEVLLGMIFFCS